MEFLITLWETIDVALLMIFLLSLFFPQEEYRSKIWLRSIEQRVGLDNRLVKYTLGGCVLIFLVSYLYKNMLHISKELILKIIAGDMGVVLVGALLPELLVRNDEKGIKGNNIWNRIVLFIAIVLLAMKSVIDEENIEKHRKFLIILIICFVLGLFMTIVRLQKQSEEFFFVKLPAKNIRKDLYNRTPRLEINVTKFQLIKYCEKYFNEYIWRYRKIQSVQSIEYVTLGREGKDIWYNKVKKYFRLACICSGLIIIISMKNGISYRHVEWLILIIIFGVLIKVLEYRNPDLLKKW